MRETITHKRDQSTEKLKRKLEKRERERAIVKEEERSIIFDSIPLIESSLNLRLAAHPSQEASKN
jgi:hypothetical protein